MRPPLVILLIANREKNLWPNPSKDLELSTIIFLSFSHSKSKYYLA